MHVIGNDRAEWGEQRVCTSFARAMQAVLRRVYVSPAWVGETHGESDRFVWDIQTGETALDVLYASLRQRDTHHQ